MLATLISGLQLYKLEISPFNTLGLSAWITGRKETITCTPGHWTQGKIKQDTSISIFLLFKQNAVISEQGREIYMLEHYVVKYMYIHL